MQIARSLTLLSRRLVSGALVLVASMTTLNAPAIAAPVPSPTSLLLCVSGTNATKTFAVTESQGNPNITATPAPSGIATVSGGTQKSPATYTVNAVSAGSTTITVSDSMGTAQVAAKVNGQTSVSPVSMSFSGTATQDITVTEPGPPVGVTAVSSDTTVATVTASATTDAAHHATLTVTPVNGTKNHISPATATITVSDAAGCASQTVSISVTAGALTLSPTSLTLAGSGASKTFTASETLYNGLFSASSANTQIATVSPASGNGPGPTTFTVSPVGSAFGPTTVTVTDDHAGSQQVNVVVTGGTITAGSNSVTFTAGNNTNAHLAAAASIAVTGSLQTTSSGTGQIAVASPSNITGTHGGTLLIGYLTYTCTATGTGTNQGGSFASGFLQLIASASAAPCVTFPNNQFSSLSFNMNLFLDARALPADSYSGSGFQIVLSAT